MFGFNARKSFSKSISDHVVRRTIEKTNRTVLDSETNKVITNVNVFRTCMIATVASQRNSGLIVPEKGRWLRQRSEHLSDKASKPESFFRSVCRSDVFGFRCGESNELLFPRAPENCPSVDEKSETGDSSSMLLSSAICVDIPNEALCLCPESQRE